MQAQRSTPITPPSGPAQRLVQESPAKSKLLAIIKHEGVVYHFYNAVGKEGRVIALATAKDLRNKSN
jgi:hypothetical protein